MFHSARLKLTAWYLLTIMVISLAFSGAIYRILTFELDRVERAQRLRIELRFPERLENEPPFLPGQRRIFWLDSEVIAETKKHLLINLAIINLTILGASALAGYFLAGQTLMPINEMVEEQGRFITDASHELRTPLTSLKSEIEVNLRDKKLSLDQAKSLLKSNLEEVNNLQILSDGLIKLTQYQKTKNGLEVSQISLNALVEEAVKKIAHLAKEKKIVIANKVTDLTFEGNHQTLIELLVIFLDNAIKYSPKNTSVSLSSDKKDGHFLIQIKDQGIGIEEKEIPHLFNRFFRTDKSRTKSEVPGYGLGLAIAKQIVERHNGLIKVKSQPGVGTTFSVQLPIKHPDKLI